MKNAHQTKPVVASAKPGGMSDALDDVESDEDEFDGEAADEDDEDDAVEAQERARSAECATLEERAELEDRAASELAWFFGACRGTVGGSVPAYPSELGAFQPPARTIAEALRLLLTFDRGALALMFTPRAWPEAIERRLGSFASLVVRLESARRPPEDGASLESLEQAAVKRLETKISMRSGEVRRLIERAEAHERRAIRAYLAVRGNGPALGPSKRVRKRATFRVGEGGDS
jgi:hypothetical protein